MMNFSTINVEINGPLGRLTLNRPERLNAMNATMLRELAEAARWFDEQRELRVVIVSGAGRAFCAGADLKESPMMEAAPDSGKSWLFVVGLTRKIYGGIRWLKTNKREIGTKPSSPLGP
jgi:enoyl-CoA hydratase/carnithine racemase